VNSNAQKISASLADVGVDVYFHTVVGDNLDRMAGVISTAVERSDVVVITGGLGPTPDDITREGVAKALGVGIERHDELVEKVRAVFERFKREMPESNLRQADLPAGAVPIEPEGTAPGFFIEKDGTIIFALPGVPWEMEAMLQKTVVPMLREKTGSRAIVSREVIVIGLGESHTHERIADLVERQTNPTIAYRAGAGQIRVRITAAADSEKDALALIRPVEEEIRARLGEAAVPGDKGSLPEALGEMLRERGATVAVVESLTGGSLGAELTRVGGSGDFFKGGIIAYATEAKATVAGIDGSILEGPGPVSEEAAAALAEAAAHRFGADLGLATTGVAGPAEQDGKPVGTIYVAATFGGRTEVRFVRGYGGRSHIREVAVTAALDLGRRLVQSEG
jgi:nicotinamide-nucleotide amidase